MRGLASLFLLALLSLVGSGCLGFSSRELPKAPSLSLVIPTKDEVALVDGRPLSLAAFFSVKAALKTSSNEVAFWAGTASLAFQNASRPKGSELPAQAALQIARYALGELGADSAGQSLRLFFNSPGLPPTQQSVRAEADRLLASSTIRRNDYFLASLSHL